MKKKIKRYLLILCWNFLKLLFSPFIKTDKFLMLFGTVNGKFTDNPKYLYLYVAENEKNLKPVWITKNKKVYKELKKQNYNVVIKNSFKAFFLAMRAKYYFFSHNIEDIFYFKRKNTIAVNLWHGSPLKKMGFDTEVDLKWIKRRKKLGLKIPYEKWDYLVVAHEVFVPFFKSSMRLPEEKILPFGLPRNDILWEIKENKEKYLEIKKKVSKFFNIYYTKKIILYAPTFRDNEVLSKNLKKEIEQIIPKIKEIIKDKEYKLLLRLHPLDKLNFNREIIDNEIIFDATEYEDMQELLAVSDILITDYSSSMFDFTILGKPIILYMFDEQAYKKIRGGFYNIINNDCFHIVFSRHELAKLLKKLLEDMNTYYIYSCERTYNVRNASKNIIKALIK